MTDQKRGFHQCPSSEVRFGFLERKAAVSSVKFLERAANSNEIRLYSWS